MAKQIDFDAFLTNIEPSRSTVEYISSIQSNLRAYLEEHEVYKKIILSSFLSGSYAKHTAIRPASGDKNRDVDIIVVTCYTTSDKPSDVLNELCSILKEKNTYSTATVQSHSVGLKMAGVSVDVVPVIKCKENDKIYYVGSSIDDSWKRTDPKGHKSWATNINNANSLKFKPLVKIFKWWRRKNCPDNIKYPKGITLEKIIADNIGDSSLLMEDLFIGTMQNIVNNYSDLINNDNLPFIEDPSDNITGNNLLAGYSLSDLKLFIERIENHLKKLNEDGACNDTWRSILGIEFPRDNRANTAYTLAQNYLNVQHRQRPPWQMRRTGMVSITAKVTDWSGQVTNYENDSYAIEKHCTIVYTATYSSCKPFRIVWQIVNTGFEARNCLRGGFEDSNVGKKARRETTLYTGKHFVQCFVIDKYNNCVARSKEFFINVK